MLMHAKPPLVAVEKPQNGLAGLKYWRQDIRAGLLVSLISLPFSLGIAIASGAPPIAGLVSAIVAGLLLPFLGGSYLTISGPAAGLAPVLLASMLTLGSGDLVKGYPLLLGVICIAGCVQIVLSLFKAARFSALFPSSVVEGMLASIGLLIIAKQLPNFLGRPFAGHEFFEILREAPSQIVQLNPQVFLLAVFSLALIFALSMAKAPRLRIVPPQVVAVVVATVIAAVMGLDSAYLIHIPDHPLDHGLVLPNFSGLFADSSLWLAVVTAVVTLTLIDGVESLATAVAIDKIDPYHRKSNPNRVLMSMGILNICSSMVGGLTIIPGGVKSKACIVGGGRTLWANFYNAIFLLIFLFVARDLINMIPLAALAAVLVFTGYKLCEPRIWRHVAHIGREQLLVFAATVAVTLSTDLLWGIAFGSVVKLLVNGWFVDSVARHDIESRPAAAQLRTRVNRLVEQFRNPVASREWVGDAYHIYFEKSLVCFNNLHVANELNKIPADAKKVYLHLSHIVALIDHTSCENLLRFVEEHNESGHAYVRIVGLERMSKRSAFPSCMRLGYADVATGGNGGNHVRTRARRSKAVSQHLAGSQSTACLQASASAQNEGLSDLDWMGMRSGGQRPEADHDVSQFTMLPAKQAAPGWLSGGGRIM